MDRDFYIRYNDDFDPDWSRQILDDIKKYESNFKYVEYSLKFNSEIKDIFWINNFIYYLNSYDNLDYLIGIFKLNNGNYMYIQDQNPYRNHYGYYDDYHDRNHYGYYDDNKNFTILVYVRKNFKDIIEYLSLHEYNLYLKTIQKNDKNKLKQKIELFKEVHQELIERYWSPFGKGYHDLKEKYKNGFKFD